MTNTQSTASSKLSPHFTWLFAFGSIAAGIAITYALSGLGQKVTAALYFAIVGAGGFASTYLTSGRTRGAVLAFLVGGGAAAFAYFELVSRIVAGATTVMTDAVSVGAVEHANGAAAASTFGHMFGIIVAAAVFLETIVAGIIGAVVGAKTRDQGGLAGARAAARLSL